VEIGAKYWVVRSNSSGDWKLETGSWKAKKRKS
jgi:hypothetical protein